MTCPCGIGDSLATCCGPIISGAQAAPTAEALMRARYTAYTQQSIDFILESVHPESKGDMDRRSTEAWSRYAQWHGLEILNKSRGAEGDEEGEVEFVAKFSIKGTPQRHHERAQFKRHAGKWLYFDGDEIRPQPVSGPRVKPSRNDDCPCGSSRKFKKCCGPVWESGATTPEQLVRARFSAAVTGEAGYLARSLHPDAKELTTYEPTGTVTDLKLIKVTPDGDDVEVESSYTETADAVSSKKHAITRCRRLGDRWLLLSASLD